MILTQPVVYMLQAEPPAEHATGFGWNQIVESNIINIVLAAVILVVLFKKFNLLSLLDNKQAQVIKELKEAEAKREQALQELAEIEKRASKLTGEVSAILKDAEETAETVAKSIIQQAEEDASKLLEQSRKRIAQEELTVARTLETRLMQEAIHGAKELLESTLSKEDRVRSVEDFVSALPALTKGGQS